MEFTSETTIPEISSETTETWNPWRQAPSIFWKLEAGSQKPEVEGQRVEAGSQKLEAGSRKPEARSRKPAAVSLEIPVFQIFARKKFTSV